MIPAGLPTLSAGAHKPGDGKACVMELVSFLAGESWTDSPECTHPVLARMAQVVNDRLPDDERHLLVPLIGRLFGTAPTGTDHERKVLSVRLAVWCGRQSLSLVLPQDEVVCTTALDTAEAWTMGAATAEDCYAAYAAYAAANAAARAAANATHADYAAALVSLLAGLIDEYDRLTCRTEHRAVTDSELSDLAAAV